MGLYLRVLVGIALGIVAGIAAPAYSDQYKWLLDAFIRLVTMVIGPVIFCTLTVGIARMHGAKQVGKATGLALVYFEVVSTLALAIGLAVVHVVNPGGGMNHALDDADRAKLTAYLGSHGGGHSAWDWLIYLGGHHVLYVVGASLVIGFVLHYLGPRAERVTGGIDRASHIVFRAVAIVMQLAPIGAFGAIAFTIATFGASSLEYLAKLMGCFYATCLVFIFGVLGLVARLHGFSLWRFLVYIRRELLIVLGTSSSESVLPRMMEKLEGAGGGKSVVRLVVPMGYSFNLDGTAIYVTMGALFIAQATNTPLGWTETLELLGIAMLTSKGAAGVTGAGLLTLVATLEAFGPIPAAGVAIILGIDRFMSEARALTNVIGNGIATLVVARWCKDLDRDQLKLALQKQQESR